jgi:hypothetical protein
MAVVNEFTTSLAPIVQDIKNENMPPTTTNH